MKKTWHVAVGAHQHVVVVKWDVLMTGGGHISVDGIEVERWSLGMKLPGVERHFVIGTTPAVVRQGCMDFELLLSGQPIPASHQDHPMLRIPVLLLMVMALAALCSAIIAAVR